MSLPAWGVRVEIASFRSSRSSSWSLPAWGVRVEIGSLSQGLGCLKSLPAWGVRVAMKSCTGVPTVMPLVTPRMGSAG